MEKRDFRRVDQQHVSVTASSTFGVGLEQSWLNTVAWALVLAFNKRKHGIERRNKIPGNTKAYHHCGFTLRGSLTWLEQKCPFMRDRLCDLGAATLSASFSLINRKTAAREGPAATYHGPRLPSKAESSPVSPTRKVLRYWERNMTH